MIAKIEDVRAFRIHPSIGKACPHVLWSLQTIVATRNRSRNCKNPLGIFHGHHRRVRPTSLATGWTVIHHEGDQKTTSESAENRCRGGAFSIPPLSRPAHHGRSSSQNRLARLMTSVPQARNCSECSVRSSKPSRQHWLLGCNMILGNMLWRFFSLAVSLWLVSPEELLPATHRRHSRSV